MDPKLKNAIERLFNVLGKKIAKDYYNLDLNFKVVGELKKSPDYLPDLMIQIQTDKKLPTVLRDYTRDGWDQSRYDHFELLQIRLGKLLKYLGFKANDAGLILNPNQWRINDLPYPDEDDYIDHPERFTSLVGETYVLENNTGWVYYLGTDKKIDQLEAYHITEIEGTSGDDWFWNNLTDQDKRNLERLYG
jgi:hypothetical protein